MYELTISHVQREDDGRAFRMGEDESVVLDNTSAWQPESEGELFRLCQKEYGRCISRVYCDENVPSPIGGRVVIVDPHGWVFQRRERYEEAWHEALRTSNLYETRVAPKTFLHETWVVWKLILGNFAAAV